MVALQTKTLKLLQSRLRYKSSSLSARNVSKYCLAVRGCYRQASLLVKSRILIPAQPRKAANHIKAFCLSSVRCIITKHPSAVNLLSSRHIFVAICIMPSCAQAGLVCSLYAAVAYCNTNTLNIATQMATRTTATEQHSNHFDARIPSILPAALVPRNELGIDNVSGFYGPGAMGTFYLLELGSWVRIFTCPSDIQEGNTWGYLVMLKIASVDLIIKTRTLHASHQRQEDAARLLAQLGSIWAALTVVWWGTINALCQLLLCFQTSGNGIWRRIRLLITCIFIPATALCSTFLLWDLRAGDIRVEMLMPFILYGTPTDFDTLAYFRMLGLLGAWYLVALLGVPCRFGFTRLSRVRQRTVVDILYLTVSCLFGACLVSLFMLLYLLEVHDSGGNMRWLIFSPCLFFSLLLFPVAIFPIIATTALDYTLSDVPRRSCFMIPCTANRIIELDQAAALYVALISVIGLEIIVSVTRRFTRRWQQSRWRQSRRGHVHASELETMLA